MSKTLYIMCGVPGSGKTWFAKNKLMKKYDYYISRDEVRFSIIKDDEEYFSHETVVFNKFVEKIAAALLWRGDGNVIADATHLNWGSRRKLLNALKACYPIETLNIIPVVIEAKLDDIFERNKLRDGRAQVPEETIRRMYKNISDPVKDPYKYTAIMRVRN